MNPVQTVRELPLKPIRVVQMRGMDFIEADQSANVNHFSRLHYSKLTKWPVGYVETNHKAETVAGCLYYS